MADKLNADDILATWPTTADGVKYVPGMVTCDANGCQFRTTEIGLWLSPADSFISPDDPTHDKPWQWLVYAQTLFKDGWRDTARMNYWNGYSTIAAARARDLGFVVEPDESPMATNCPVNPNPQKPRLDQNSCQQ